MIFRPCLLPTGPELSVLCHSTSKEGNGKPRKLAKMKTPSCPGDWLCTKQVLSYKCPMSVKWVRWWMRTDLSKSGSIFFHRKGLPYSTVYAQSSNRLMHHVRCSCLPILPPFSWGVGPWNNMLLPRAGLGDHPSVALQQDCSALVAFSFLLVLRNPSVNPVSSFLEVALYAVRRFTETLINKTCERDSARGQLSWSSKRLTTTNTSLQCHM